MKRNISRYSTPRSFLKLVYQSGAVRLTAVLIAAGIIGCMALIYVSASKGAGASSTSSAARPMTTRANPSSGTTVTSPTNDYVSHSKLWSQLQEAFHTLGDRLEKPGKERLTLLGTLEKSINSQTASYPFRLVWELPGRLRLEEFSGAQPQVTTFDGASISKLGGLLSQPDQDAIETLLYDSAEHFFIGRAQGYAMRFLGGRFTTSGDDEAGPAYDLYEVVDHIHTTAEGRQQIKHYYLNSDTQLIEKVRYQLQRGAATVAVEVQLSNWGQSQGQQFPGHIVRLENGAPVLTLTISSAGVSPKADDGVFVNLQRR